ncbi:MAG: MMPL family transporter, partial [Chloroflexi bacterium]|nr:MMPL family transporter [Chloroflexota bacterium]
MVFARIGHFATRYRIPIIVAWIAAAILVTLIAPNIEDVASSDTADFLPANAPFAHAEAVYQATFPDDFAPGSSVIVVDARATDGVLNLDAPTFAEQIDTEAGRFIVALGDWLNSPEAPAGIQAVMLPTSSPTTAALMIASEKGEDPALANKVALVRVDMNSSPTEDETKEAVNQINAWMEDNRPSSIQAYQTGASPIVNDTTESIKTSVDRTIWVTVVLVVLMLLAVYRSPISPLIPLLAVTLAYLITRGIVATLGEHTMTITSYANILLVVVMYGAGTDYCLFLISRFREEMADLPQVEESTAHTVHRVGETITSSAGTIFVGFMSMMFAEMGIFNTSGPALAIGIVLSLASGLTLVPALLATLGDHAFWPNKATHRANGRLYEITSKWVSLRPLIVILVIVAIMAPFSIYGINQPVSYDILADLPDDKPAVVGFKLMKQSLGAGNVMPLTVVVTGRDPQQIAADIVHLTDELAALPGVRDVRGLDDPLGQQNGSIRDLLQVNGQLALALTMMESGGTMIDPATLGAALNGVQDYLDLLAAEFPEVADDPNLLVIRDLLDHPLQLATRQEDLNTALAGLMARFETVENPYLMPTALAGMLPESDNGFSPAVLEQLNQTYLAEQATAFKLDVVLVDSASSFEGMDTLTDIRHTLKPYQNRGEAVVSGGAAINTDIRDTMSRDLLRAIGFVLIG